MPRDRLSRPFDLALMLRRQQARRLGQQAGEAEGTSSLESDVIRTPTAPTTPTAFRRTGNVGGRRGWVGYGSPRSRGRGWMGIGTPSSGRENMLRWRGRSNRARNSVLPSWYPRTPLRDITTVVRTFERRRARVREAEVEDFQTPARHSPRASLRQIAAGNVFDDSPSSSSAPPEPKEKRRKLSLDVDVKEADEGSEALTPEKKLLESIDTVEQVVKEELQLQKESPSAKKEDRKKRVRTLMSFR